MSDSQAKVRILGTRGSPEAFAIRDFLHRSDVPFRWIELSSDEQARRGQPLYHDACSACHGDSLKGSGETPALAGNTFLSNWNGLPLGDLFERIRRTMPQDKPSRVNRQQKSDILAYLLSCNGFPVGKTELPHQTEFLNEIRFDATKPDPKK